MDIVRLRIMTRKSTIDWGDRNGKTVEYLIKSDPNYLVFVYYNHKEHSFNEEVLSELGISEEFRIEKPGTNYDLWFKYMNELERKLIDSIENEEEKEKAVKKCKKRERARRIRHYKVVTEFEEDFFEHFNKLKKVYNLD